MKNEISEIGYFFVLQKRSLECFDSQQVNNFWPTLDNYCVDIKFDMIFLFSYFLIIVMHLHDFIFKIKWFIIREQFKNFELKF